MVETEQPETSIDWALTTWEGSRREALRRWSRMPLERVIAALEEMAEISQSWEHTHPQASTSNLVDGIAIDGLCKERSDEAIS